MALKLWSKLENAGDVTNPQLGTGGVEYGSPTYIAAKFNNGMFVDANAEGAKFPTVANSINIDKGTVEFWVKMKHNSGESISRYLWSFKATYGILARLYQGEVGQSEVKILVQKPEGGQVFVNSSHFAFLIDDLVHFGITWDREGNDIGGGKTVAVYKDNVEIGSSITTWATGAINADLFVGIAETGLSPLDGVVDNIKTYDVCKTDFSDRNQEDAGANQPPTTPTSPEVDGKSAPTGANCVGLIPLFSAIFNDPDVGDQSNAINIQVGSASGLSDMWDSGWLADSTVDGNRCGAKNYAGAALSAGTSYWWRCRFRDDDDSESTWSSWQQFDICAAGEEAGLLECAPGGPLPKRRPFRCAVALPRRVPSWLY